MIWAGTRGTYSEKPAAFHHPVKIIVENPPGILAGPDTCHGHPPRQLKRYSAPSKGSGAEDADGSGFCNDCRHAESAPRVPGETRPAPGPRSPPPQHRQRSRHPGGTQWGEIQSIEPLIGKSTAIVPRDPLRPIPPVRSHNPKERAAPAPVAEVPTGIRNPCKETVLMPRLFSPWDALPPRLVAGIDAQRGLGPGQKNP